MSKIKIAISGIGAVGGYYGGLLAAAYQDSDEVDVFFISRGENLQAIKENGIQIKRSFRKITARPRLATDNPSEIGVVDYLLCCTKSYDLEANIWSLAPIIGPETVILPLLNGADITEQIQKLLPDNKVWKGCVYIGASLTSPGNVEKFTLKDRLFFGLNNQDKEKQKELRTLLTHGHILTTNPDDIDIEIWKKFYLISPTATITSYFNEPIHEVIDKHTDFFITLGHELLDIAHAKGINLPKDIVFSTIQSQKTMPKGATTSMHRDFKQGKQTEIETLTGYVIREAEALNMDVPTYQFMYQGLTQFPYPR